MLFRSHIIPIYAKALIIPVTQAGAQGAAERYFANYKMAHPRTQKQGISPAGAGGKNLSYRNAGIIKVGGQTALLRKESNTSRREVGGHREFVYLKPSEVTKIIRGVEGFTRRQT